MWLVFLKQTPSLILNTFNYFSKLAYFKWKPVPGLYSERCLSCPHVGDNAAMTMLTPPPTPYPFLRIVQGILDVATLTCNSCPVIVRNRRRCYKRASCNITQNATSFLQWISHPPRSTPSTSGNAWSNEAWNNYTKHPDTAGPWLLNNEPRPGSIFAKKHKHNTI